MELFNLKEVKNSRNGKFEFEFLSRNKINLLYIIDKNQNRDLIYSVSNSLLSSLTSHYVIDQSMISICDMKKMLIQAS
jgi:hypothetical protein